MKNKLIIILLAGLAQPGWSAGIEELRALQQAAVTPGSLPATERGSFPQPELQKLDLCVLSEMKNNKCYFKCESGAIAVEPAVRPDFSSGEPVGPCSPYVTRQVTVTAAVTRTDKSLTSSQLDGLLKDTNPEVRKAAVKSAKSHIQNSYAQDRLLDIFKNKGERTDIRVEAVRTLSYVSGYTKTQDAFTGLLKYNSNEPRELRVMTYKALWGAAAVSSRHQDFLIDAVKYSEKDPAARRAAIWALFPNAANFQTQDLLIGLLKYGNEDELVKVEAIKSLYGAAGNYNVKELLQDIVESASQAKPVRLAALKALSGAAGDSSVQRFIEDVVRSERDQDLRVAAVEAASPDTAGLREFFHLGYRIENGGFVSPIERE